MSNVMHSLVRVGMASAAVVLAASAGLAQSSSASSSSQGTTAAAPAGQHSTGDARRDNLLKMQRPVTIDMNETPLEEVFNYLREATGAELEPLWKSDTESEGLDKETKITLSAKNMSAMIFLEKVLSRLENGLRDYTWQMDEEGPVQVGPKKRLNKFKRVEIYDINDLLFILPVYDNAPQIDLNQVLQSAGRGGGTGQSPFRENQNGRRNQNDMPPTKEDRAKTIKNIVTDIIEKDEWADSGGEGGAITYHEGAFIINAADYMHRQVNGYRWWPTIRSSAQQGGRRYVSLNVDSAINQLDRPIRTLPVTATAGGPGGGSPPGGG